MLIILAIIALGMGILFSQTATPPAVGDGSVENPYQIATLDNLYWLSQNSDEWYEKHYIQTADIDASSTNTWDDGKGFSPIGVPIVFQTFFDNSSYDGQDYSINGLFINRQPSDFIVDAIGLFGCLSNSIIKNLSLTNVNINGGDRVGALIGIIYYDDDSMVENCNSSGVINGIGSGIGGLIGVNNGGDVKDSFSSCEVTGKENIGWLIGSNSGAIVDSYSNGIVNTDGNTPNYTLGGLVGYNGADISNCHFYGTINANDTNYSYVGGLIGYNSYGAVTDCYSTCTINGSGSGGLIGTNYNGIVTDCHSNVTINGNGGGLITNNMGSSVINNCYSTGVTNGIGGLIVFNESYGIINNCYSTVDVTSDYGCGGLVGYNSGLGTINNCFWDTETSGLSTSDGGTGKTTAEMKSLATFTDVGTIGLDTAWDFEKNPNNDTANEQIWNIDNSIGKIRTIVTPVNFNDGYPFLGWQNGDDIALLSTESERQLTIADGFTVLPAYPNPFNPSTTIRYGIPQIGAGRDLSVQVNIYDITGKLVTTLFNGEQSPGWHFVTWNGTDQDRNQVPAGVYLSKVTLGNNIKTNKLMLLK